MDKTVRIFLACATGAGIGTLSALQLGYLWGLGALLGGLVGYLVYDLEQVIKMIPVAWHTVSEWKLDKEKSTRLGLTILFLVNFSLTVLVAPVFLGEMIWEGLVPLVGGYGLLMSFFLCINAAGFGIGSRNNDLIYVLRCNPFTVYIYYPIKGVVWTVPRIPAGLKILASFCKQLFILIHSDLRLLCGVDSLIGATVGYFTGSVLIGALVGGALGVLNYEIVSKRWLKVNLAP